MGSIVYQLNVPVGFETIDQVRKALNVIVPTVQNAIGFMRTLLSI